MALTHSVKVSIFLMLMIVLYEIPTCHEKTLVVNFVNVKYISLYLLYDSFCQYYFPDDFGGSSKSRGYRA